MKLTNPVPLPGEFSAGKCAPSPQRQRTCLLSTNAPARALRRNKLTGKYRHIPLVVLVGGSSLDFVVPQLVTDALAHYRPVAGRVNIRGSEAPKKRGGHRLILSPHKEFPYADSNHSPGYRHHYRYQRLRQPPHEVLLGIEEEGIPSCFSVTRQDAVDSAWQAARSLPLLVA